MLHSLSHGAMLRWKWIPAGTRSVHTTNFSCLERSIRYGLLYMYLILRDRQVRRTSYDLVLWFLTWPVFCLFSLHGMEIQPTNFTVKMIEWLIYIGSVICIKINFHSFVLRYLKALLAWRMWFLTFPGNSPWKTSFQPI